MNLLDGLDYYKEYSDSDWQFTLKVESAANEMSKLISRYGDQPNSSALAAAHALLVEIEKWKAMCLKERMGNAEQNSQRNAWNAFRAALSARNDLTPSCRSCDSKVLGHLGTRTRASGGPRWQPLRFGS